MTSYYQVHIDLDDLVSSDWCKILIVSEQLLQYIVLHRKTWVSEKMKRHSRTEKIPGRLQIQIESSEEV